MAEHSKLLRGRSRAVVYAGYSAVSLGIYLAHRKLLAPEIVPQVLARYRERYVRQGLQLFGVEISLATPPARAAKGARMIVANHRSAVDIPVLLQLFPGCEILARGDIADWPVMGEIARIGGTIFVDRAEGMSRATAVRMIRHKLQDEATVAVFAEGTTFQGDTVHEFSAGAFAAARGVAVEVIPVGIAWPQDAEWKDGEDFPAHLANVAGRKRTPVAVAIGQGVYFERKDPRIVAPEVQAMVQALVHQARQHLNAIEG